VTVNMTIFVLKTSNQGLVTLNIMSSMLILSGFVFTLYSRLHLVMPPGQTNTRLLRGLLITIIGTAFLFYIPLIIAAIIALHGSPSLGYKIYKFARYADLAYAVQDSVMSFMYIYFCRIYVEEVPVYSDESEKRRIGAILWQLVTASIVVLICDVSTLVLLFKEILLARYVFTPLVFALKLKVEVFALTRLVNASNLKREIMARGYLSAL